MSMENFIVRIYRRESDDPNHITGVIEKPDSSESKRFSSVKISLPFWCPMQARQRPNGVNR